MAKTLYEAPNAISFVTDGIQYVIRENVTASTKEAPISLLFEIHYFNKNAGIFQSQTASEECQLLVHGELNVRNNTHYILWNVDVTDIITTFAQRLCIDHRGYINGYATIQLKEIDGVSTDIDEDPHICLFGTSGGIKIYDGGELPADTHPFLLARGNEEGALHLYKAELKAMDVIYALKPDQYDDIYFDTDFIEYDYYFDSAVLDYAARGERMYFVLSKDGSDLYYGPDFIFGESTNVVCRVDGDLIGLSSGDTFETGTYTISLYYVGPYGDEIVDVQSCFVEKSVVVTPSTTGGGNPGDTFPGEGEYYAFEDLTFRSYVINAKWFDYDGYRTGDAVYSTDVLTIAFSLEVDPSCNMTVDYSYYYTDKEDRDSIGEALQNPVYSNTVSPTSYSNGTFYDIDYPVGGEAAPGFYMFVIYEAGTSNVLMYGFCNVA